MSRPSAAQVSATALQDHGYRASVEGSGVLVSANTLCRILEVGNVGVAMGRLSRNRIAYRRHQFGVIIKAPAEFVCLFLGSCRAVR